MMSMFSRFGFGRARMAGAAAAEASPANAPQPDARQSGAKANAPGDTKAVSGLVSLSAPMALKPAERSYAALAREGYMRNPVAHRAIRMIAEACASVPWLAEIDGRPVEDHPALELMNAPSSRQTGVDFIETLVSHLLLSGNAYVAPVLAGGRLREIHLLRPDRVRVVPGPEGWPAAHEYRAGGRLTRYPVEPGRLSLLHLASFHPLDDHQGLSPLDAAQAALDLANAATLWNKALIDNSARPSGALVYQPREGGNLTAEQYRRLKEELEDGYSGVARAGRPMLLEGGLDWKAMGLSPREMDFAEARNGASRDIALALGVPPMLIGIPGDATYANYQEANRAFFRLTIVPLLARLAASFSAWLGAAHGERLRLGHDLDQVAGLSAERDQLWARLQGAGFLTEAEKRAAVGYGPRGD